MPFFIALETEIEKAALADRSVIIEMDANAKLGKKYIKGDPHEISPNGQILAQIVERQYLVVGNGASICKGTITRRRVTRNRTEQSVIDVVLFSADMFDSLVSIEVDEARKYVLTKVVNTKKGPKVQESDHNPIVTEFKLQLKVSKKEDKLELYNLKNRECQIKFKEYTTNTNMLSTVFDADEDVNVLTNRFLKKLDRCIATNFKKIRMTKTKADLSIELYSRLHELNDKDDTRRKDKKAKIIEDIARVARDNLEKIRDEIAKIKPNEGGMNEKKIWKLKKKLCPQSRDPPTAMLDDQGNLLTANTDIEKRALEVYQKRLEGNTMVKNLRDLEIDTNKLCENRLKI